MGFILHQRSLELVQDTGLVSLSSTPKGRARSVKREFLDIFGDHKIACHDLGDASATESR